LLTREPNSSSVEEGIGDKLSPTNWAEYGLFLPYRGDFEKYKYGFSFSISVFINELSGRDIIEDCHWKETEQLGLIDFLVE